MGRDSDATGGSAGGGSDSGDSGGRGGESGGRDHAGGGLAESGKGNISGPGTSLGFSSKDVTSGDSVGDAAANRRGIMGMAAAERMGASYAEAVGAGRAAAAAGRGFGGMGSADAFARSYLGATRERAAQKDGFAGVGTTPEERRAAIAAQYAAMADKNVADMSWGDIQDRMMGGTYARAMAPEATLGGVSYADAIGATPEVRAELAGSAVRSGQMSPEEAAGNISQDIAENRNVGFFSSIRDMFSDQEPGISPEAVVDMAQRRSLRDAYGALTSGVARVGATGALEQDPLGLVDTVFGGVIPGLAMVGLGPIGAAIPGVAGLAVSKLGPAFGLSMLGPNLPTSPLGLARLGWAGYKKSDQGIEGVLEGILSSIGGPVVEAGFKAKKTEALTKKLGI